jgi:hypothetical protein
MNVIDDDRVEETEPWNPRDRRRFWIAVVVTLVLVFVAVYAAWYALMHALTFQPDRLSGG